MTIWKYELDVTDYQKIEMPKAARILTVQVQHDVPCIWALVDDKADKVSRKIRIFGTGHYSSVGGEETRNYIGTFQIRGGGLVFHVFDLGEQ